MQSLRRCDFRTFSRIDRESENAIKTIAFDIISGKVPESTRHEIEDLSSFQVGKTPDDAGD